jgi:hypothetical protein
MASCSAIRFPISPSSRRTNRAFWPARPVRRTAYPAPARFPDLNDPARLISEGVVMVNGIPSANPRARVHTDAAIRIYRPRPLRGTIKLAHALAAFGVRAAGVTALDLGAAAGGFTQALLDAGW